MNNFMSFVQFCIMLVGLLSAVTLLVALLCAVGSFEPYMWVLVAAIFVAAFGAYVTWKEWRETF